MIAPATLIDIMRPLMDILEDNRGAPIGDAIGFELLLADDTDSVELRETYADKLATWNCPKRAGAVREEAKCLRAGGKVPRRRFVPPVVLHYPFGCTNVGTEAEPEYRSNADLAQELVADWSQKGGILAIPTHLTISGGPAWWVEFPPPECSCRSE